MKNAKAIFIKQVKDMMKNPMVLVEFIIFPAVAFIMTQLVAVPSPEIPDNMFVAMMAPIFAGMALVTSTAVIIAEDIERKSLRFLVMAGVKPHEYLLGIVGFVIVAGTVVSAVFGLIGEFTAAEFGIFLTIMTAAVIASILFGAVIGMMSKNQQAATALSVPVAMVFGFTPMIANFNKTVEAAVSILYTQQINIIINDFNANFGKALLVTATNIAVLSVLFVLAYRKNGLRG